MKLREIIQILTPTVDSTHRGIRVLVYLALVLLGLYTLGLLWPYILMAGVVIVLVSLTGKGSKHSREFGNWLKREFKDLTTNPGDDSEEHN